MLATTCRTRKTTSRVASDAFCKFIGSLRRDRLFRMPPLFTIGSAVGMVSIIIDTRPDLDILTQNALYAADRAIIPVKDMPSEQKERIARRTPLGRLARGRDRG